jgi:hypothetical protein
VEQGDLRSDDDIEAILKIAVSQVGGMEAQTLRERLMATAAELGLTPEQVAEAERKWAAQEKEKRDLAEFNAYRKSAIWSRLGYFAVIDALCLAANYLDDRSFDWAVWVVLITGFLFARRAARLLFPTDFQRALDKWRAKRDAEALAGRGAATLPPSHSDWDETDAWEHRRKRRRGH